MGFLDSNQSSCIKWARYLHILNILTCGFLISPSTMAASIDPQMKEKIDKFIRDAYLPANNNPALGLTITNGNGSLLYSTGFELMDVENQQLTTNQTLFLIGSISKSFTAVIVCKTLHEKFPELGSKVLDTPVRKLIPDFNFTLNDRYRTEATTFRDMLSHRVCSKSDGIATFMVPFQSASEVAYRQRYAEEQCGFRTGLEYNNGMYALIASSIEAVANRSYENLILDLLRDLEMHNSTIVRESDDDKPPNRAIPYYWRNGKRHNFNPKLLKRLSIGTSAGGIVSTALDMNKYLQFHLNKGKVGVGQLVPAEVIEWMYQVAIPSTEGTQFKPDATEISIGYGLGLHQAVYDGWQKIRHTGVVTPFTSHMSIFPGKNVGIFTATNQMPEGNVLDQPRLHNVIFDILRCVNKSSQILNTTMFEEDRENQTVHHFQTPIPVQNMRRYVGTFGNGLQGEVEISTKLRNTTNTTELYMNYGTWGQAYLLGTHNELQLLLSWDSDVVQEKYAFGISEHETFGVFSEDFNEFHIIDNSDDTGTSGKFRRGVRFDDLPPIPWSPESCGQPNLYFTANKKMLNNTVQNYNISQYL